MIGNYNYYNREEGFTFKKSNSINHIEIIKNEEPNPNHPKRNLKRRKSFKENKYISSEGIELTYNMRNSLDLLEQYKVINCVGYGSSKSAFHIKSLDNSATELVLLRKGGAIEDHRRKKIDKELLKEKEITTKLIKNGLKNILEIKTRSNKEDGHIGIMPYCNQGNLRTYLTNHPDLTLKKRVKLLYKVSKRLKDIHGQDYCHLDIKPENILLHTENNKTKIFISDFGSAKKVNEKFKSVVGTPEYRSPECTRKGRKKVKPAMDVFSFGTTLYEVVNNNGKILFPSESEIPLQSDPVLLFEIIDRLREEQNPLIKPLYDIVIDCIHPESEERITMKKIKVLLKQFLEHLDPNDVNLENEPPEMMTNMPPLDFQ